jgi:hypothetical protein
LALDVYICFHGVCAGGDVSGDVSTSGINSDHSGCSITISTKKLAGSIAIYDATVLAANELNPVSVFARFFIAFNWILSSRDLWAHD